jgi:hypothetical protein
MQQHLQQQLKYLLHLLQILTSTTGNNNTQLNTKSYFFIIYFYIYTFSVNIFYI